MKKMRFSIIKILSELVLVIAMLPLQAQTPNGSTLQSATPIGAPAAYKNTLINYVRSWEPCMATSDPAAVASSTDVNAVKQSTQYFDGLGHPLQTVTKGFTPTGRDLVAPVIYDIYGRVQFNYLRYVPTTGNLSDGKFKADPFNDQRRFYESESLAPGAKGETIYYSQTEFEASPLNRILKTYAAGNSWAKNDPSGVQKGGNRPIEHQFLLNTAADAVRIWDMPATGNTPTSGSGRIYEVGQLYKDVTKDEQGVRTIEFRDKNDRVVLERAELTIGAADGHTGWLCTYYIYDDLGNLRCVIPPKAVEIIKNNWVIDATTAAELCFFYEFDNRNRMVRKKVPGANAIEMAYDVRDRLVFTQDGNLKGQDQWLTNFYDVENRIVMTALYNSSVDRDALQTSINGATSNSQSISYTIPGVSNMVIAHYDGTTHNYEATNSITLEDGFDSGVGADILAEINSSASQGTVSITATNPLPNILSDALTPLTYTFYDTYDFQGVQPAETGDFNKPQVGNNQYGELLTGTSSRTKGMVTGIKVKILGTADGWLTTTIYYDDKGRVIQTISNNITGGKDILTNLYDFSGKLLSSYLKQKNQQSGITPQTTLLTMVTYDAAGRLKIIEKKHNEGVKKTIVENNYDELGQLKTKRLGINGAFQLETLSHEYNIRGWLKSINKGYLSASPTSNWFGQELSYDYGFTTNQYNGNIAGSRWKSGGDGINRAYGYSYDNANRLVNADFRQQNIPGAAWTNDKKDFSVSNLGYDPNGNISTMTQKGMIGAVPSTIDQLSYTYKLNSNKLATISDPINTTSAKIGDFMNGANTGDDYAYDANGNLTQDLNRNVTSISYNYLNLPQLLTVSGKGNIRYVYDATGNKLRKIITDNTASTPKVTIIDYIGNIVYRDNVVEFVGHEEGRIRPVFQAGQSPQYFYDYFVKDHLGNVRTVLTEQADFTMYAATMETSNAVLEAAIFSNVQETRSAKPVGYPLDPTAAENQYVAKLNAKDGGNKIGPSLVLKVMAGDTIQIGARAFYKSTAPRDNKSVTPEDMVAGLLQAFGGQSGAQGPHAMRQADRSFPFGNFNSNDYQQLKEKDPNQNQQNKPKAYLNFVLFDDQFNLVEKNSGVRQVKGPPDALQTLAVDKMPISKSGFLYVYASNETAQDVFFDNVTVTAINGPLLEETHYYPFGLTAAGISYNALQGTTFPRNRIKYNGNELQNMEFKDGTGLELYDFQARTYDSQIGRFLQIDAEVENHFNLTPFHLAMNNPLLFADPLGMDTVRGPVPPTDPNVGDVIVIPGNNGTESYYTYGKDGRWVGTGMNGGTLNEVVVKGSTNKNKTSNIDNLNFGRRSRRGVVGLTGMPMPMPIPGFGVPLPPLVIPAPNPILLTIALVFLPANFGQPSSDHVPLVLPKVYSKGGPKNVWPDGQYTKPNPNRIDWGKGDQELADEITGPNAPKGPKTPNNLIKKWFRDKRPK